MKINKPLFFFFLVLLSMAKLKSQTVISKAYSLTLKTLLSHSVQEIDVQEAAKLKDVIFIDAREEQEYKVSHLKDAIWVGFDNQDLSKLNKIDKNQTLVVYCSVGFRSEKTIEKLNKMGYSAVYNLYGGIFEWKNQNQAVYRNHKETEEVHAYNKMWGFWLDKGIKVYD